MSARHNVGESPFMKRVLVPFWVIRGLIMFIDIILYALVIAAVAVISNDSDLSDQYDTRSSIGAVLAILVVGLVTIIVCMVLDIVCMIKRGRRTLSPRFFLITNVIQTTVWTIHFVVGFLGARTLGRIIIAVLVYLSFLGLLVYAAIIFHQHRKGTLRGNYQQTQNPAAVPLAQNQSVHPSYNPDPYNNQTYNNQPYPAQQPQYNTPSTTSVQKTGETHEMVNRY